MLYPLFVVPRQRSRRALYLLSRAQLDVKQTLIGSETAGNLRSAAQWKLSVRVTERLIFKLQDMQLHRQSIRFTTT